MKTTVLKRNVSVSLPDADLGLLKDISSRLGWVVTGKTGSLDKGIEDIEKGRLHTATDSDDLINQILG